MANAMRQLENVGDTEGLLGLGQNVLSVLVLTTGLLDRTKRVKDARSEAQKEIEDYKRQKENEFKEYGRRLAICL